ncbi:MAG: Si-specific NAD(P)(+) transhydrogenase [Solirubrobacterales bacterium]
MTSEPFDLVVIGAGPAGEKAGAQAAYFGKRVAIVDRRPDPGGSAASKTGVPTKTLREAALYLTGFRRRDLYGTGMDLHPDTVLEHMRARTAEVVKLSVDAVRHNIERHGIELIQGEARLGPDRTVRITTSEGERVLRGEVVMLATGSRPFHPPGVPFEDPDVHDSESILELERIPNRFAVIGGGPVGCEYASIFLALGAEVTMIDRGPRLLPFADGEVSEALGRVFEGRGMRLLAETAVTSTERTDGTLTLSLSDGKTLEADAVLFASGRAGTTEGIGLEEAGVRTDERDRIVVDETYRTTAEGIYAAGDVIGPPGLASAAMEQGRVAACHAFGIPFKDTVDPLAPLGVYSVPEVAMVGMTEEAARESGIDVETGRTPFEMNARARIAGATEGLVKLVFAREDRRLLGVHIVGDDAAELIHIGQAVLHAGGTIDYFIHSTFNVPTLSEAYKYAAYDGLQRLSRRAT